jgi:hypothetical protein
MRQRGLSKRLSAKPSPPRLLSEIAAPERTAILQTATPTLILPLSIRAGQAIRHMPGGGRRMRARMTDTLLLRL